MNKLLILFPLALLMVAGCSRSQPAPVPVPEPKADAPTGGASISPDAARKAGVETSTADAALLRETLLLYGSIQPEPDHVRTVTARFPGVVRSVVCQVGDRVSAGQTLATVESNESLQTYAVTSPLSGVVTQRKTNPGEFAGAEALLEVADFSAVRAELSVFPRDRLRLKVGQKSKIQGADAETLADGVLSYLAPLGSAQNQTITARVALPNREGRWTPGQFVTAEIVVEETRAAVTVVPAAIQQIKGRSVVFIQTEHGFEAREVDIGRRGSDSLEIKNGLRAGERYVSKNSFLVKAEVLKSEAEEE
jgi:cobalt-zinc-cadmium efflux system membrane fusion protein